MSRDILYVIAVISNPVAFESRYRLFKEFEEKIQRNKAVRLIVVEHAFGKRKHQITSASNPYHLQLRGGPEQEIWIKEGMINAGFDYLTKLDPDWEYASWIDADVEFTRDDWAEATIEALEHYSVVQPWSHSIDLGPVGQPVGEDSGFIHDWFNKVPRSGPYKGSWHPGYAWAINRTAWESLKPHGLLDWSILGSADHIFACGLIGNTMNGIHGQMNDEFKRAAKEYQALINKHILNDVGYVDGTILHKWHGSKKRRFYIERWQVLIEHKYDPYLDIDRDEFGIPRLIGKPLLRNDIRRYFRSRNEDSDGL